MGCALLFRLKFAAEHGWQHTRIAFFGVLCQSRFTFKQLGVEHEINTHSGCLLRDGAVSLDLIRAPCNSTGA